MEEYEFPVEGWERVRWSRADPCHHHHCVDNDSDDGRFGVGWRRRLLRRAAVRARHCGAAALKSECVLLSKWIIRDLGDRDRYKPIRSLHVDKRGRQPRDLDKLHARSFAEAENNAHVFLLVRHTTCADVDGDVIRLLGPAADRVLHGCCCIHSAVHLSCSSSRVTHICAHAPAPPPHARA
jgi:hypothetical protein